MSELRELYQELILDHGRKPRNFGCPHEADCSADGRNPLCGDHVRIYVKRDGERVTDVHFDGDGCAICLASASMMTERVCGHTVSECRRCFSAFHDLVTGKRDFDFDDPDLGKLAVFAGVREFPIRVKCATLAWHALNAALENRDAAEDEPEVSTE